MKSKKVSITATIRAEVEDRFNNCTATKYDEVMLALFNENLEQRQTILALSLKLSMCENTNSPVEVSQELTSIMYGAGKKVVIVPHAA